MNTDVPYMPTVKNVTSILDKVQNAGVPDAFGYDFLRDLGFSSSNDRAIVKFLKYLGMLDSSGKPQTAYREFTNHTKAKSVLADRLRTAFDDLYLAHKDAHTKSVEDLKGWFKTKTGSGDAVAKKIATTFKAFASYADFSSQPAVQGKPEDPKVPDSPASPPNPHDARRAKPGTHELGLGLVYRLEIHLPDTQNVETYRAIFKALREELMG